MGWGLIASLVLGLVAPVVADAREPALAARAALVMDAATGDILWERNGSTPYPPASTTKVMTGIIALESGRLDDNMRVSADAAETAPAKINLRPGQRMRLRNLVYAALLNSANDAAAVIAEGLAGSEAAFAVRMNQKAREIGASTAHFVNPHGLTAPGHVASVRDLATIFRYGLHVPLFRDILETQRTEVPLETPEIRWVTLHSHNRLLTGYTYPVIGKTGYTRPARRCFVGAATNDGREIIVALLGSNDLWGDAKRLFAFGFGATGERPPVVMVRAATAPRLALAATPPRAALAAADRAPEGDTESPADDLDQPTGHYAVQLGPYRHRQTAITTRAHLAQRGYTASLHGRALRIGSFETIGLAHKVAGRLKASGYKPLVVALR